jgi:RNA polymerase sigma factor for flagellar operon FliA
MVVDSVAIETVETTLRDQLVLDNLSLVRAIAVRVHESLPVHVDLDDLVHAGVMGLFDAATKYDSTKEVAFKSYAKHRIKGSILDSLRQLDWASRDLRKRHKQLETVTRELSALLERAPTEVEIAEKMGVDLERWRQMAVELRMIGLLSASTRTQDDDNQTTPDFPAHEDSRPDSIAERKELSVMLKTAINTLPARYQQVVVLYYTKDMTMKEIGTVMDINESRVSQIHKTALEKMAVAMRAVGVHSSEAFV